MTLISTLLDRSAHRSEIQFGTEPLRHTAAELLHAGSQAFGPSAPSAVVGILMTNDRPTVELVLGAIAVGARLVSLPLPGRGADPTDYLTFIADVCGVHGIDAVVARDDLAPLLRSGGVSTLAHADLCGQPLAAATGDGFQLVQFTSGSTGAPKAIELDDRALGANVAAIMDAVSPRSGDTAVSWLPLSHDMGLVGMLLTSVVSAGPERAGSTGTVLLTPEQFLRAPGTWMRAMDDFGGTYTAAPDFGYRLAVRHSPEAQLDLSAVRCAILGGEIVRADTLNEFTRAFATAGWNEMAFCPAYGMAEVGLAVTLTPPEELWRHLTVDPIGLADHQLEEVPSGTGMALVACGPPLRGYEVQLADTGSPIADISVLGPSIAVDATTGVSLEEPDGRYETGDLGFVNDGRLYVCGRQDDYLVIHGRNVYAPAVESAITAVPGVRPGRGVTVGLPSGDWITCVEPSAELDRTDGLPGLRRAVRVAATRAASGQPSDVIVVRPGSLPMTPSGKLQRHLVRRAYLRGSLEHL